MNKLTQSFENFAKPLQQKLQSLPAKDRFALTALGIFLLVFLVGFGGWELHQKANASQKSYSQATNELFWLRSQAGNINPNQVQTVMNVDNVRELLQQSGITAQVGENGENIQLNFSHSHAPVINNVFNQLTQQGFVIKQLQMNQITPERIEVQSVIGR